MGIEDFYELQRLIGRPYSADAQLERTTWDTEAWEAANRRFETLIETWLQEPLITAGFRGKAPRWVFGRGPVRPVVDLQRRASAQLDGLSTSL